MRLRRTISTALAVAAITAPVVTAAGASAAEPIGPVELSRCDISADTDRLSVRVATVASDLTTGRDDATGSPIPYTQVDDTWTIPAKAPDDAYSIAKHPAWIAPASGNWINSRTDYTSTGTPATISVGLQPVEVVPPDAVTTSVDSIRLAGTSVGVALPVGGSTTVFDAAFTVPAQSYLNRLDLRVAADNDVILRLNGTVIGTIVSAGSTAFTQEWPFAYTGTAFKTGVNHLTAEVTDYGVATGLLVRGGYSGCQVAWVEPGICVRVSTTGYTTYAPAPIRLDTGSHNGIRDAIGAVDSKWHSVTNWTFPDAYSVSAYPGWFDQLTTANWIHERPDPRTGSLGTVRTYAYEVEFNVSPGATYQDLDLRWAADDTARFYLNGTLIPTAGSYQTLTPLHWTGTFNTGVNTLRVEVVDTGLVASGLLVEGGARVCYTQV
ncbi:MAG TPA: hypothetical protein VF519_05545 [Mycobacteriales bacterium]|jgi:hypothetical protein